MVTKYFLSVLASLPRLTELRLDLNVRRDPTMSRYDRRLYDKAALLVADIIPQLKFVSLFIRCDTRAGIWKKYNVPLHVDGVRETLENVDFVYSS